MGVLPIRLSNKLAMPATATTAINQTKKSMYWRISRAKRIESKTTAIAPTARFLLRFFFDIYSDSGILCTAFQTRLKQKKVSINLIRTLWEKVFIFILNKVDTVF
jgi:hypothetical protein